MTASHIAVKLLAAFALFVSLFTAPARAETASAVAQDMRGFGDEQYARMTASAAPAVRIPALAAIYDAEQSKAPSLAPAPSRDASHFAALDFEPAISTGSARPAGMPLTRVRFSSSFGMRLHPILGGYRMHKGVDLAASAGSPIRATADGIVGRAGWAGGYGLSVQLEHSGGVETRYAHMERFAVTAGQRVRKGETIGYVGSTGRSTGPHLHYEVLVRGQAVNPLTYAYR